MKKILLLIASFIIIASNLTAQDFEKDTILARQYYELGEEYYNEQNFDSSSYYYNIAADIYKKNAEKTNDTNLWKRYINCLYDISWNLMKQNKCKEAIDLENASLKKAHKSIGEKNKQTANLYCVLGAIYENIVNYDKAQEYYQKSLDIRLGVFRGQHEDVATSYLNIGCVYVAKSEYDKALEYFQKALDINLELFGEKHTDVANLYNNIGCVYDAKSEYDKALEYYQKSLLDIRLELLGEKHSGVATSYNNIGIVYYEKLEYDKALKYLQEALDIRLELLGEKHTDVAASYINIGGVYDARSEYNKALEYYQKALGICLELFGEKHVVVASIYNNIGVVYLTKSEYNKALEYYQKALDIRLELLGEKHIDIVRSYNNIGDVYSEKSEHFKSIKYYHYGLCANLIDYYDTEEVIKVPKTRNYIKHSSLLISLQSKAQIFADTTKNISEIGAFTNLQRMQIALRHYQAADTLINKARQEITGKADKLALGESAHAVYSEAVELCHAISNICPKDSIAYFKELAFDFSEKNKSSVLLESLAGAEAMQFAGIPDSLLEEEHKLQIDVALYKRLLSEQPDSAQEIKFRDKLFRASRSYDSLMQVFEKEFPEYHTLKYGQNLVTIEQLQKILDKETAIISYLESDSMLTVFEILKDGFSIHKVPKGKDYEDMLMLMRANINTHRGDGKIYANAACKLYKQLFPSQMKKNIKNLLIIPSSSMSLIPFEALLTEKYNGAEDDYMDYPYLQKKYSISYAYSANLYYRTLPKEKAKNVEITPLSDWIALAPVFNDEKTGGATLRTREMLEDVEKSTFDSTAVRGSMLTGEYITPLPGTESEVKSIFKKFEQKGMKALVQLNENANEEYVKSGALETYKYLHIASHGIVDTYKPELSGIILSQDTASKEDGILHTGEIYNLKLNADLTVLSACETGLGKIEKGEGLIGLSRALLYAGTKNIIVSLWKVADNSTKQLMVDFYSNLLEDEEKGVYAEALQKAKLKMISEKKYAHPYYWSPFILIGR